MLEHPNIDTGRPTYGNLPFDSTPVLALSHIIRSAFSSRVLGSATQQGPTGSLARRLTPISCQQVMEPRKCASHRNAEAPSAVVITQTTVLTEETNSRTVWNSVVRLCLCRVLRHIGISGRRQNRKLLLRQSKNCLRSQTVELSVFSIRLHGKSLCELRWKQIDQKREVSLHTRHSILVVTFDLSRADKELLAAAKKGIVNGPSNETSFASVTETVSLPLGRE